MNIFNDVKFLNEDHKVADIFDFKKYEENLEQYLDNLEDKGIVAITGDYGSGKSTMLYSIANKHKKRSIWLTFDAWKYPDRKELWEGFVLDIATQIGVRQKIINSIDGKPSKKQTIAKGGIKSLYGVLDLLVFKLPVSTGIAGSIMQAFGPAPVKRIFELQDILFDLLNTQDKPIFIVVEDIDRSGSSGVNFIETLSNFIRTNEFKNEIKILVPMSPDNYNKTSYEKSIDYKYSFRAVVDNIGPFIENVLSDEIFNPQNLPPSVNSLDSNNLKLQLNQFLSSLLAYNFTPRIFKTICRDWNAYFKKYEKLGLKPDYRIVLLVQASKHIPYDNSDTLSEFDETRKRRVLTSNNILNAYCQIIGTNTPHMKVINTENYVKSIGQIYFLDIEGASTSITLGHRDQNQAWYLPSFYLD